MKDIPRDMMNFYIYLTKTGFSNDSEFLDFMQVALSFIEDSYN